MKSLSNTSILSADEDLEAYEDQEERLFGLLEVYSINKKYGLESDQQKERKNNVEEDTDSDDIIDD